MEHLLVKDDKAIVELRSLAMAKDGMRFDNRYCWVVYFRDEVIVTVVRVWIPQWSPASSSKIDHIGIIGPVAVPQDSTCRRLFTRGAGISIANTNM